MSKKKNDKKDQAGNGTPESKRKIARKKDPENVLAASAEETELAPLSSAEMLKEVDAPRGPEAPAAKLAADDEVMDSIDANDILDLEDPVFTELARPKLPELAKDNRARLLMQSPTRIQFYWSMQDNPFKTLDRALGNAGSYVLVAKLVNESAGRDEIVPVEAEGSYWFNVDANSVYHAELGFYAPNRPFVRIMFSNTLETPRKSPSPRQATDADWAVSADEFAGVLESTGYFQDAVEVALAGDDPEQSDEAAQRAFSHFIGKTPDDSPEIAAEEIRFALLALASGFSLADLRGQIGPALFAILQYNAGKLTPDLALSSLGEYFDIAIEDSWEEEPAGSAVFGASLVHFPRSSARRRISPKILVPKGFKPDLARKIAPVSSLRDR